MRAKIPITVLGSDGRPLAAASVTVRKRSDASTATVYSAETGGGTLANPLTTDAQGRVGGWCEREGYDLIVTGSGISTYTEAWDAAPARAGGIDEPWLADDVVIARVLATFGLPIGAILEYGGTTPPAGADWLLCNGDPYSRSTYADLFAVIGTAFGAGDGSTTFNVPDRRGRVGVGRGTHAEVDTIGENDGLAVGSRKIKHRHGKGTIAIGSSGATTHRYPSDATGSPRLPAFSDAPAADTTGDHTHPNAAFTGEVGDTAGPLDGPAFIVVEHIIRAR
jgi:microcystin-dependent protein